MLLGWERQCPPTLEKGGQLPPEISAYVLRGILNVIVYINDILI